MLRRRVLRLGGVAVIRSCTTLALVLIAAGATAAYAADPTVTVSFEDPVPGTGALEDQPINATFTVYLDYALPLAYYQNVVITMPLPDRVQFPVTEYIDETSNASFTFARTTNGVVDTLKWTAASFDTGVSGRISVTLRFDTRFTYHDAVLNISRFGTTLSGTSFPFDATITGQRAAALAGPYTAFSAGDGEERVATGTPLPQLLSSGYPAIAYGATFNGVSGQLQRYSFLMHVGGNAGTRAYDWNSGLGGIPLTLQLGPASHFVRAFVGGPNYNPQHALPPSTASDPSMTIVDQPIPYGQPQHVLGGTVRARVDAALIPYATTPFVSAYLYVDVFLPCAGTNPMVVNPLDHVITIAIGNARQELWDDPEVVGTPSDLVIAANPATGTSYQVSFGACGTGGHYGKSYDGFAAVNTDVGWVTSMVPPIGLPTIDDALLIDRLPEGSDNPRSYIGSLGDILTYFCELPGVDYFDAVQFGDFLGSGACGAAVPSGDYRIPPAGMTATHVAYYALTWGTTESTSPRPADFYVTTHVRADYTTAVYGTKHVNRSQFQGHADGLVLGNALMEEPNPQLQNLDPWEAYAIRTIVDWSCPGILTVVNGQPPVRDLEPGECGWVHFRPVALTAYEKPKNAVFDITVPDGVVVTKTSPSPYPTETAPVDGVWASGGCFETPGQVIEPNPGDRPLRFELGTIAAPCKYETFYGFALLVEFCLDPAHAWTNGESLVFTASVVGAANRGAPGQCPPSLDVPLADEVAFTVDVPPEIEYLIAPTCESDGGPSFTAEARNSGGEDLTGIVLTLQIPRIADGSEVDAVFAGVDRITHAPGAIVEVSAQDPPATWVAESAMSGAGLTNADVRWVRLRDPVAPGIGIVAISGPPVSMRVRLSASGPGSALASAGEATADQLGAAAPATPPPFILGSCAYLDVHKFLDADGDGLDDAEPALRDWAFTVTNPLGTIVASGVTDSDGDVSFYLPGGVYTVTETLPVGGGPIFQPTTPSESPSASQDASLVMGGGDVPLSFGNACSCPNTVQDLCSEVVCRLTNASEGAQLACDGSAQSTCDDGNACSSDLCDPSTGACTHASPTCQDIDYFVPVANASGVIVGNVHCRLVDGAAPECDLDGQGRLLVVPLGAAGSTTCGLATP